MNTTNAPFKPTYLNAAFSPDVRPFADVKKGLFGEEMKQLALDFNSAPTLMELVDAKSAQSEPRLFDAPDLSEAVRDPRVGDDFDDAMYIEFALSLLQTCAEDLIKTAKTISVSEPWSEEYKEATELRGATLYWLSGAEAPFSLEDCALLLEEEVRNQAMGQIYVPSVCQRRDELAQWIIEDPVSAKKMLSAYKSIFSTPSSSMPKRKDADSSEDFLFEESFESANPRSMRVRHG